MELNRPADGPDAMNQRIYERFSESRLRYFYFVSANRTVKDFFQVIVIEKVNSALILLKQRILFFGFSFADCA